MAQILLASQRVNPRATLASGFSFRWPDLGPALDDLCGELFHELIFEQWVPQTPEQVPVLPNAYNLEKITPDFLKFNVRR